MKNLAQFESESAQDWTLIQITDTHLMDQPDLSFAQINPEYSFQQVMQHIQTHFPQMDALIHTGDLAQVPVADTYARYLQSIQALNVPYYQIPGNHDDARYFPFYRNTDQAHAIRLGTWSLILLNSAVANQVDGWIEQTQLDQLDQLLTEHRTQHIVIACHHHPFAMQSRWIDQHRLKNADSLKQVIARHQNVKLVLFGHVHQDSCHAWQGVAFLSAPSTSVQFKPRSENFALDQAAPGYRVVHLYQNGGFETHVQRIAFSEQNINTEISGY
ncbi:3',5'-cyclic-AMP phosphodiesterase [Acinetobacter bohemicus]|uniref:3',5'-cyclic-AMP phosphodiesterase n=1 Tax=Acinetobacter lwoffii TaxID=28090 RepID=A0A9D2URT0_ACILW|nr:3',5'-cyclic-AMP phosphodiesterase [Acinetobacter sp. S4397-1]MCO8043819.1 3',5'-cyclic-AMP phosphodiesterase [Acinetobacter sp. S4397-1]HJF27447.1 3',5'-cyclic-AMP phosphodiesterase [Acinetobacter lwoffii]